MPLSQQFDLIASESVGFGLVLHNVESCCVVMLEDLQASEHHTCLDLASPELLYRLAPLILLREPHEAELGRA
jgi:hypothetical protein